MLFLGRQVTAREGRVSRNNFRQKEKALTGVTSREGRVSRNRFQIASSAIFLVTSREGRVSRNHILPETAPSFPWSRPARDV